MKIKRVNFFDGYEDDRGLPPITIEIIAIWHLRERDMDCQDVIVNIARARVGFLTITYYINVYNKTL